MRMIERRGSLCFLNEAAFALRIGNTFRRQHLHRDKAIEVRVPCFVYDTHAPLAELLNDLVLSKHLLQHFDVITGDYRTFAGNPFPRSRMKRSIYRMCVRATLTSR